MKQLILTISLFIFSWFTITGQNCTLAQKLESLPHVKEVKELQSSIFSEKYQLSFEQYIDPTNPSLGTFTQRVFVNHVHPDSATVVVTEGYGAQYGANPRYREEISKLFNTNLVVIEHRYFLESTPEGCDWDYLTTENAARDHHNVVTALKAVYPKKWIATGISKGGQTATMFRAYYPEDVDISVPYVAPLCKAVEDGRHEPFIAGYCGTPKERRLIKRYQIETLKRKEAIMPLFDSLVQAQNLQFNLTNREIFDYCVLEFPFALWQWGTPVSQLPDSKAPDREFFNCLVTIASPDYFEKESSTQSFFVQAAKELGYYGYDTKPFRKWLDVKSSKNYLAKIFLPQNKEFEFNPTMYDMVCEFLNTTDSKMLFIYGQYDPWSAVKVDDPCRENIKIFIDPNGSHRARVGTFPEETQKEIKSILAKWLYE